jgi:hypothetical protein
MQPGRGIVAEAQGGKVWRFPLAPAP